MYNVCFIWFVLVIVPDSGGSQFVSGFPARVIVEHAVCQRVYLLAAFGFKGSDTVARLEIISDTDVVIPGQSVAFIFLEWSGMETLVAWKPAPFNIRLSKICRTLPFAGAGCG
jgi:hypothetical protein